MWAWAKEIEKLLKVTKNVIATGQHTAICISHRFTLWRPHLFATVCRLCLDFVSELNVSVSELNVYQTVDIKYGKYDIGAYILFRSYLRSERY